MAGVAALVWSCRAALGPGGRGARGGGHRVGHSDLRGRWGGEEQVGFIRPMVN
jgi:hypothetical protein